MLPSTVHPRVMSRYVERFQESDLKRIFAEKAWNHFKTEGVDLKTIPSIEGHCAFAQDTAARRDEVEAEADGADENWDFEGIVCADKVAASKLRGKLN